MCHSDHDSSVPSERNPATRKPLGVAAPADAVTHSHSVEDVRYVLVQTIHHASESVSRALLRNGASRNFPSAVSFHTVRL